MDNILRLEYACTPAEVKEAEELLVRNRIGGRSKWLTTCILLAALVLMLITFYRRFEPPHRSYMFVMVVIIAAIIMAIRHLREKRKKKASESADLVEITAQEVRIAGESGWATLPWGTFGKVIESKPFSYCPTGRVTLSSSFPSVFSRTKGGATGSAKSLMRRDPQRFHRGLVNGCRQLHPHQRTRKASRSNSACGAATTWIAHPPHGERAGR